jgi:coenzyme F420-reducing hydrogenase delta subunit
VIEETREILRLLGVDERRLQLKWISASEGAAFAGEIHFFVQILKELGENPFKGNGDELSDIHPMVRTR